MDIPLPAVTPDQYHAGLMAFNQSGDITQLPMAVQVRLYHDLCLSYGLDPRMRPFSLIKSKSETSTAKVLYLTAAGADAWAAAHGLTRKFVSPPHIEDLNGRKVIAIHCVARDGRGREEEDFYYRDITNDSISVQMLKAQTAAKRRVTKLFINQYAPLAGQIMTETDVEDLGWHPTSEMVDAVAHIVETMQQIDGDADEERGERFRPVGAEHPEVKHGEWRDDEFSTETGGTAAAAPDDALPAPPAPAPSSVKPKPQTPGERALAEERAKCLSFFHNLGVTPEGFDFWLAQIKPATFHVGNKDSWTKLRDNGVAHGGAACGVLIAEACHRSGFKYHAETVGLVLLVSYQIENGPDRDWAAIFALLSDNDKLDLFANRYAAKATINGVAPQHPF